MNFSLRNLRMENNQYVQKLKQMLETAFIRMVVPICILLTPLVTRQTEEDYDEYELELLAEKADHNSR